MAESLFSILSSKDFDEPVEITAVKSYIARHFNTEVPVGLKQKNILISVPSAAMAGAVRAHVYRMIEECSLPGKVIIRISR